MDLKGIEGLAELARLELTEEEKESLLKDLDRILEYVKQVEGVKVSADTYEYDFYNSWREDEVKQKYDRERITSQFPASEAGYLKVKKIL